MDWVYRARPAVAREFSLVPWLRGLSIHQYFAQRDPVAGTVYYAVLGVFAVTVMPVVLEP